MEIELGPITNEWALGCYRCDFGLLSEPEQLVHSFPAIYMRRAVGQHLNLTNFCSCQAGNMARQKARKHWNAYGNEFMVKQARTAMSQPPVEKTLAE
jgi:hypothetical protein